LAYLGEPLVEEQRRNAGVVRAMTRAACPRYDDAPIRRIGPKRRRIAVVSPSLAGHSVERVWSGALLALDPAQFELFVFCPNADASGIGAERWRACGARFSSGVRGAESWIAEIRACAPDIVIFLDIGMHQYVQVLASLRHAPVQATTWAHPITS